MTSKPIGRSARQAKLDFEKQKSFHELTWEFGGFVNKLRSEIDYPDHFSQLALYNYKISALIDLIDKGSYKPLDRIRLYKILEAHSRKLIQLHALTEADPVIAPIIVKRQGSNRSEANFHTARIIDTWHEAFNMRVASMTGREREKSDVWLGLALWSATAKGHLGEINLVKALFRELLKKGPIFRQGLEKRLAIKLKVKNGSSTNHQKTPVGNIYKGETLYRIHYYHPDPLTLALIGQWLLTRPEEGRFDGTEGPKFIFRLIKAALNIKSLPDGNFLKLTDVFNNITWLADTRHSQGLSEAVLTSCKGQWISLGLDNASFTLCSGRRIKANATPEAALVVPDFILPAPQSAQADLQDMDWSAFECLQRLFTKARKEKKTRSFFENGLHQALSLAPADSMQWALITWYLDLFRGNYIAGRPIKPLVISSVMTYHSKIACKLIDAFGTSKLSHLDSTDFESLYLGIIDLQPRHSLSVSVSTLISYFHSYGTQATKLKFPKLDSPLPYITGARRVRSRAINAKSFKALIKSLSSSYPNDPQLRRSLCVATLLAARGGLRLGEVMKLKNDEVEASDEIVLSILANSFGNNKSYAARRQIEFGPLLAPNELKFVKQYMSSKKRAKGSHRFLAIDDDNHIFTAQWLSQVLSQHMCFVFGGSSWTFHHLRHMAANNLFLALSDCPELTLTMSGWDKDQQEKVVSSVICNPIYQQKRPIALSTFLGHASPEQTFSTYIHLIEPLISHFNWRNAEIDNQGLSITLNLAKSTVDTLVSNKRLNGFFKTRLLQHTHVSKSHNPNIAPLRNEPVWAANDIRNFENCVRALSLCELGQSVEEVSQETGISEEYIDGWKQSALRARSINTKRGVSRLFSKDRLRGEGLPHNETKLLLLPKNLIGLEKDDSLKAILFLKSLGETDPDALSWIVNYFKHNIVSGMSGLCFNTPSDLDKFVRIFDGSHIYKGRWRVELLDMVPHYKHNWYALNDIVSRLDERYSKKYSRRSELDPANIPGPKPKGIAYLHLIHYKYDIKATHGKAPPEGGRRSAQMLRYTLHVAAIILDTQLTT